MSRDLLRPQQMLQGVLLLREPMVSNIVVRYCGPILRLMSSEVLNDTGPLVVKYHTSMY